jgi:hypothetical protein
VARIFRIGFVVVDAATAIAVACSEADPGIVGEVPWRGAGGSPAGPDGSGAISTTDAAKR